MKKISLLILFIISFAMMAFAQSGHDKISYQSVVRDGTNRLVYNTPMTVAVSIANSGNPAVLYSETHTVTSNANGLISFLIGNGSSPSGSWDAIQWNRADITLVTSVNGTVLSTHTLPLSAVPYALYAKDAAYADSVDINVVKHYVDQQGFLTQEVQVLSISNDTIFLTGGSWVKLPAGFSGDYNDLTNKPDLAPVATSGDYNDLVNKPDINNATLTIQKNGTNVGTFTANASTDKEINITVPTKTSELNNDSGFITADDIPAAQVQSDWSQTSTTAVDYIKNKPENLVQDANYVHTDNNYTTTEKTKLDGIEAGAGVNVQSDWEQADDTKDDFIKNKPEINDATLTIQVTNYDTTAFTANDADNATLILSKVAGTGSYNDLTHTPPIPAAANDATLTIQRNEVTVGTFSADASTNSTVNIVVPTKVSDLSNDSGYITGYTETDPQFTAWDKDYNDLINTPPIPAAANNATLTIQRNEVTVGTFSADASTNATVNITVPTTVSQLSDADDYAKIADLPMVNDGTLSIKYGANDPVNFTANQAGGSEITIPAPNDGTLSITYGTNAPVTFTANQQGNSAISIPAVNDGTLSIKYGTDDPVTFTANQAGGSEITIPAPNNATINITTNGTSTGVTNGSFTLNQSEGKTIDIALPTTVAELTDANQYAKINGNTFTGSHSFTSLGTSITVPSNEDAIKRPVPTTTPATECTNLNAVNVCDLLAVFDSLNKRMDNILKTIDTLKHVNDSLSQELEALKPALKITGPTNMSFCGGSNAATYTATMTNANVEDYTYSWSVNGSAQSTTGTNMTFSPNTTGSYKVVCTATRPGYDAALKDSTTVNVSAGGVLPSSFGLCKEGLAVTVMISDVNISSISWGDGGTTSDVTTNSYSHDYSTSNGAGTYTITAMTSQGCSVSRTVTLSETTTRPCTVYSPHTNTTEYTSTTGGLETLVDGKVVSVQDQDGHSYYVTQIGDQCWMRTNLRTTKYNDGSTIPGGVSYSGYSKTDPYHYINPSYNDSIYGYFYNWPAAAHRNSSNRLDLCPKGWHVPSQADLETLLSTAGVTISNNIGTGAVYLAGGCEWELYTQGASSVTSNSYENPDRDKWDFTAVPAGSSISSTFVGNTAGVYFWSSTEVDANHAKTLYIGAGYPGVENNGLDKENGRLVRCVRDEGSTPLPTLSISHNPENLTVCGGNPLVVTYTATPSEGEIGDYSYSWSDGTNVISTEATCEITYTSAGNFSVICTATHTDDGYDITADNNITVNSADAPRFAFAVDTTSVIIKVITEGASITDWGGNGTTGGSASLPCVAVFNYSTSGIYNITATNSISGCATTRRVAVGEATLHPCAVSSAHPAQTGITGDGLETTVSSQDSITTVADYDGNVYAVVQIGTQCWLKSNLRARHFSDGTQIVNGTEAGTVTNDCLLNATSTSVPYYYRPESNSCGRDYSAGVMSTSFGKVSGAYNEKLYGLYYNWSVVMDDKGICPHGWHVPTQAEWNTMIGVVVSENGAESDKYAYLLSEGNDWDSQEYDWNTNSSDPQYKPGWFVELRNASEFSAVLTGLAGGSDSEHGTTDALGRFLNRAHSYAESYFWSSTSNGNDRAVSINLSHLGTQLTFNNKSINSGYSVRCVRDGESGGGVVSDDPTLSVTSDATASLSVCGSTSASVTYTASITNGETGDYNYTWNSVPAGTVDPNHDYSYSVTYTTPGTYTVSCTATPKENVTAVDPATMSVTVTVGGCPCTVTSVGTNEVEGSETNTISAVKDAQNQQYRVVKIGSQCWMAQNLRSTSGLTQGTTSSSTDPYYYDNTNSTFALEDRGIYYNWLAVMGGNSASNTNPSGVQGVCPTGWHVPSKAEWEQLETYLTQNNNYWCGNNSHNIAKAIASTVGWGNSENSCTPGNDMSGNNATGFNALPVGDYQANFGNAGLYADFWTSTLSGNNPYHYSITTDQAEPAMEATLLPENKDFGLSVRCVRDAENGGSTPTQPSVTTSAATDVTSTTATLAGTVTDPDNIVVSKGFQWSLVSGEYEPGDDVTINVSDDEITYNLTLLSPNTTYYYRAFASTTSETITGNEETFTTDPESVTPPTPSSATLSISQDVENPSICNGGFINVTYTATVVDGGNPIGGCTYSWTVPSGVQYTANGPTCVVKYTSASNYSVTCSATSVAGTIDLEETASTQVSSSTGVAIPSLAICEKGLTVTIKELDNVSTVYWGDDGESSEPDVDDTHVYDNEGVYSVTAESSDGCKVVKKIALGVTTLTPCDVASAHTSYSGGGHNGANDGKEFVDQNGRVTKVTDYEGIEYSVVQIGSQCWLAENMRCAYSPTTDNKIIMLEEEDYSYEEPLISYSSKAAHWYFHKIGFRFGVYYNWCAAADTFYYESGASELAVAGDHGEGWTAGLDGSSQRRGICPKGWHLPSFEEFNQLGEFIAEEPAYTGYGDYYLWDVNAGKLVKGCDWGEESSDSDEAFPGNYSYSSRNGSGFGAVPSGFFFYYSPDNEAFFNDAAYGTKFWSSVEYNQNEGYVFSIDQNDLESFHIGFHPKYYGLPVRCVRDAE